MKMEEVTRRQAVSFDETQQLRRLSAARKSGRFAIARSPRLIALEEAYKAVQCPAMVQVAGELFHLKGHRDVGLSTKNAGNNWTLPDGRKIAVDIITIKPTDDAGKVVPGSFVLVDCMASSGSADTRPVWQVLGENTDSSRPALEPPVPPAPDVVVPEGPEQREDEYHPFAGSASARFCNECGQLRGALVHQKPQEPEVPTSVDTDRIVAVIERTSAAELAAIDALRTDVVKAIGDVGKLLPGIFGGLFGRKTSAKTKR
jgi:hypothetical protein